MFLGRLGPLTVASSLAAASTRRDWRYPEEDVVVG
jgi:Trk-type K+ transport system membrane component